MDKPVYHANIHRTEKWVECQGIRINASKRSGDLEYSICRALLDADLPDGKIEFYDERGIFCSFIKSYRNGAKYTITDGDSGLHVVKWIKMDFFDTEIPDTIPLAIYTNLRHVQNGQWEHLHHLSKKSLIERSFVEIEDDVSLTNDALSEMAKYEEKFGVPDIAPLEIFEETTLKTAWYEVLTNTLKSASSWLSVHKKTKGVLERLGYVEIRDEYAVVTAKAKQLILEYEEITKRNAERREQNKQKEVLKKQEEIEAYQEKIKSKTATRIQKPKPIYLTPKQVEAFEIITKFPYKWDFAVPTKTKNFMLAQRWVEENNNLVRITRLGRDIYQSASRLS